MKHIYASFLFLVAVLANAQIEFEKGYYIDNSGKRHECLVKNLDWRDNPSSFVVKSSEADNETTKTVSEISELAIDNTVKFIRANVEIDRSSKSINYISADRNPTFVKETLFLKVLAEGRYVLYSYDDKGLFRFFYRKPDGVTKQLVYKKYYPAASETSPRGNPNTTDYSEVRENNQFRVQLWSDVRCDKTDPSKLNTVKYDRKSLAGYFRQVNECFGPQSDAPAFTATRRKGKFYVKAAAGFQVQTVKITRDPSYLSSEMSESGFTFGVEAEYILPWNNNKWSMIVEPNYNTFEGEDEVGAAGPYENQVKVKMNYLSVPIGMRHYMFLNDNSKIFFSGVIAFNFVMDSEWTYDYSSDLSIIETIYDFGIGAGYEYGRYSAELRYYTPMYLHSVVDAKHSRIGFTARYRIF